MSAEALRKATVEKLEKLNADAMTTACTVRPNLQTSADGLAMTVVDHLAMARAFAMCAQVVNDEYRKLTQPADATAPEKRKIREVY